MAFKMLREAREKLGISQEELAHHIGISVSQVSRVERGQRKLRLDQAARWALRLGIKIADIPSDDQLEEPQTAMLDRSSMAVPLKDVIARRLGSLQRNPFEAARKGKLERSFLNDILAGKKISVKQDKLGQLAQALDWSLSQLMEALQGTDRLGATAVREEPRTFAPPAAQATIPIIGGRPIGGAFYSAASGEEIGTLKCPQGLAGQTGVYAVFMIGSSMEPRFLDGKPVYVSATRAPAIGDDVLLETVKFAGDAYSLRYVRQLLEITSTEWVLKMHNPKREDRLKASTVKFVHRIFPQEELL